MWQDYGIDFAHPNPPTPLFRCLCNSKYCVNSHKTKPCAGKKKILQEKNQAPVIVTKGGKSSRRHRKKKTLKELVVARKLSNLLLASSPLQQSWLQ
jgi:hypothetical protein